jgi:hypothetical protein
MITPYTYYIINKVTGQYYYGSRCRNVASNRTPAEDLWIHYFTSSHEVSSLISTYGRDSFDISIIMADADYNRCYDYEQQLINDNMDNELCLNQYCRLTNRFSIAGKPRTEETKQKLREANTGKIVSSETKEKQSIAKTGNKNPSFNRIKSEETKLKISNRLKGRVVSEETKTRISIANTGKPPPPCTAETRLKIGKAHRGKVVSEETLLKMSEAQKGKILSAEHKDKLSKAKTGKTRTPFTEEHKAKISAAMKLRRIKDSDTIPAS